MVTIGKALAGLCCDGDHDVTQTPPYALLAIEGPDDVSITLCASCAQRLAVALQTTLRLDMPLLQPET